MKTAFTLIELLVVVLIIAILAAIAVPNFLEAQTRSKISRSWADLRSEAIGLESFRVDHNHYPSLNSDFILDNIKPNTTPIAYITALPEDVFLKTMPSHFDGPFDWATPFTINGELVHPYPFDYFVKNDPSADVSSISQRNCEWALKSAGPAGVPIGFMAPGFQAYDPTNGTISAGLLILSGPGNSQDAPAVPNP